MGRHCKPFSCLSLVNWIRCPCGCCPPGFVPVPGKTSAFGPHCCKPTFRCQTPTAECVPRQKNPVLNPRTTSKVHLPPSLPWPWQSQLSPWHGASQERDVTLCSVALPLGGVTLSSATVCHVLTYLQ